MVSFTHQNATNSLTKICVCYSGILSSAAEVVEAMKAMMVVVGNK